MKTLVFLPDTNKNSGLGHFYRCYKYSQFLKNKFKITFLIDSTFNKKILLRKKINFICYKNYSSLKKKLCEFKASIIFLDSYYMNRHKMISDKNYFYKTISILDYRIKSSSDILIDHTFLREKKFYKNLFHYQSFYVGHNYFPIISKIKKCKKNIILIDLGTVKNIFLINKCLKIFNKLFNYDYIQIIIINKYYPRKRLGNFSFKNKIKLFKHHPDINNIYAKTLFSVGGCGISLYEKCFFGIPTFAKSFAKNQDYNYENFLQKNCIAEIDSIFELNDGIKIFEKIHKVKINLSKHFSILKNNDKIRSMFGKI